MKKNWILLIREFRASLRDLLLPLFGLTLGIFLIAGLYNLNQASLTGIAKQGRTLLGGDLEFRVAYRAAEPAELSLLESQGKLSHHVEMRAMIQTEEGKRLLSELKAVDDAYPLFGQLNYTPSIPDPLAMKENIPGAIADPLLAERLGLKIGDRFYINQQIFELRALITQEPDRATRIFTLGPRMMISLAHLRLTGLEQPGSLLYHLYRLSLKDERSVDDVKAKINQAFPQSGWRIRDVNDASENTREFITNLRSFLDLAGLGALLLGGIGIFSGITRYLEKRAHNIAILLCIGATSRQIFIVYLGALLLLTTFSILLALAFVLPLPFIGAELFRRFSLPLEAAIYPNAILLALGTGYTIALTFGLIPLLRAMRTPPAQLLRLNQLQLGGVQKGDYLIMAIPACFALALFIFTSARPILVTGFGIAVMATWIIFAQLSRFLQKSARLILRKWNGTPIMRLAISGLTRPGHGVTRMVSILGMALTLLVALAQITGTLTYLIRSNLPAEAPSFYFLDIQPSQIPAFDKAIQDFPSARDYQRVPMLRGKISRIKGIPVEQITPPSEEAWVLRSDRGLTWSAEPPEGAKITKGEWWPTDYRGPLLISLDEDVAKAFHLDIGDELTINLLGREFNGKIANLRSVEWNRLAINFVMVFSPGILESAPRTDIATIRVDPNEEAALMNGIGKEFPNIAAVRVKDAIETISNILRTISTIVTFMGSVILLAGGMVLVASMLLGQAERLYEAIIFKTIGASKKQLTLLYALEFAFVGAISAIFAVLLGSISAYAFMHYVLGNEFHFSATLSINIIVIGMAVAMIAGFVGRWRALQQSSAPYLRND